MIRECMIDRALNRLQAHFGSHVVIRPPAAAAELARLESIVGPLPRDLTIFLITCNGLRVEVDDKQREHHLWHIEEIIGSMLGASDPEVPAGLVPVRGDAVGQRDWLSLAVNKAHSSVVRWDPWSCEPELVASAFDHYVDCWTRFLVEVFDQDGRPVYDRERSMFDASYAVRFDDELNALRGDPAVSAWLAGLKRTVACGDDME